MPFKRTYRKRRGAALRRRRRPVRRGHLGYGRTLVKATRVRSMPNQMIVKVPYYSGNVGTTTTTSLGQKTFYWNSGKLVTGVAHLARGFDQWSTMYTRYRVVGVKVTVHFASLSSGTSSNVGFVFAGSDQTSLADMTDAMENRYVTRKSIQAGSGVVTLKKFHRPWYMEGIRRDQWLDSNLYAGATSTAVGGYADPTVLLPLIIFWQSMDETASVGHNVSVDVVQYVLFDVARDMPLST